MTYTTRGASSAILWWPTLLTHIWWRFVTARSKVQ